jgi:hypothetical protein
VCDVRAVCAYGDADGVVIVADAQVDDADHDGEEEGLDDVDVGADRLAQPLQERAIEQQPEAQRNRRLAARVELALIQQPAVRLSTSRLNVLAIIIIVFIIVGRRLVRGVGVGGVGRG